MSGSEQLARAIAQGIMEWRRKDFYVSRCSAYGRSGCRIVISSGVFWEKVLCVYETYVEVCIGPFREEEFNGRAWLGKLDLNDPASLDTLKEWMIDRWPKTMKTTAPSAVG